MLDKMLEERKIKRTYYALVEGIIKPDTKARLKKKLDATDIMLQEEEFRLLDKQQRHILPSFNGTLNKI